MTYKIARDGQEFGPYSLADVQRYVGTGNILLSDLARAEGTAEWLPVSQVVGTVPVAPQMAPGSYAPMPQYPDPPNLHWALVLLFGILTCGIFTLAWEFIQVLWLKKVEPNTKVFTYFLIYFVLAVLNTGLGIERFALLMGRGLGHPSVSNSFLGLATVGVFAGIASFVMVMVYRFTMRSELEAHFNGPEPVGLTLSGLMTFFFGVYYFQYHFNRINDIKRAYGQSTGPYPGQPGPY